MGNSYDVVVCSQVPVQRMRRVDIVKGFGLEERYAKTRPKDDDSKNKD